MAKVFFQNKYYEKTAAQLAGIKDQSAKEYMILLIKSLVRMKKDRLIKNRLKNIKKKSMLYFDLLKVQADELWKMNKRGASIPLYYKLLRSGSKSYQQHALKKISLFNLKKQSRGYEKQLIRYITEYPSDSASGYFLWVMARKRILRNDNSNAVPLMERYIKNFPSGKYSAQCRYWLYRLYLKTGRTGKSEMFFRELIIENPDSYYTWLAIKKNIKKYKLKDLKDNYYRSKKFGKTEEMIFYSSLLLLKDKNFDDRDKRLNDLNVPQLKKYIKINAAIKDKNFNIGRNNFILLENYFKIGYRRGIKRELNLISYNREYDKDKYPVLAYLANKYRHPFRTVYSIQKILKTNSLRENIFVMPLELLKMLYPLPFNDCIIKFGSRYKVNRYLIYSIIKSESLFNHEALSRAGAVGLMQLLPSTAKNIARDLGVKNYRLTSPCTSIRFGTKYLAWLGKYFGNDFYYSLASYNAGIGNVKKWKRKIKLRGIDYFIESVPYRETRNYILRTGKFLNYYKLIYENH